MRIHAVTMTGFGPYRDTETVDFDAFADDGIFLITGRTGAGKTSILDAITYALFGSIPRYDGTAGEKVRSDYIGPTDPCVVALEFSTTDARYRVTRSPAHERPKLRGGGTTTAAATFELAVQRGDGWEVIESRLGNAEIRVEEIVRLNAKQFLQVILLAQGQFQEFLVATSDRRRDLLRMLFDTRRFSDYGDALFSRARALGAELAASSTAVSTNVDSLARVTEQPVPDDVDLDTGAGVRDWVDDVVAQHTAVADAAAAELLAAQAALEAARHALDAARTTRERQDRRATALSRQAALEVARPDVDEARLRLVEARHAALVWHRVEAARTAQHSLERAQQQHLTAERAFAELLPDEPTDLDGLAAAIQRWSELLGSLREAAETEAAVDDLREAMDTSSAALAADDELMAQRAEARAELRAQRDTVKASLPALQQQAEGLPGVEQHLAALRLRLSSAVAADATALDVDEAEARRLEAGRRVTQASAIRDALRERQRAGFAGVLAQALQSGEPCLVCGSPTHPSPAGLADDHVDDAALDEAEAAYELAVRTSLEADAHLKELIARMARERDAAGDDTMAELAVLVEATEDDRARLLQAVDELTAAQDAHEQLGARIDRLSEQIDAGQERRALLVAAAADARRGHDDAVRSLATARGSHASVADRLAVVTSHVRAGRALLDGTVALRESGDQLEVADELLTSSLAEHDFDSAAAAEAARLLPHEQAQLETSVTAHDVESKAVATALASDDLQRLPAEPIDLDPPREIFAEADSLAASAIGADSTARQRLTTIEGLAFAIHRAMAAAADLRERYAVVNRLASTVRGQTPNTMKMMLETFALAAELEEIVTAANSRLTIMTGGRYEFLHSDAVARGGAQSGLALDVLDAYTGETRSPQSLSGGEKFQASLALALGLAEVLTNRAGGLRLDTLFIDEGFGSLDSDTLETTMATLDNLRDGGRTIGLISHVEAMKETIPAQLRVDQTDGGWSTIRRA